jgi:hypothetical protein
MNENWVNIDRGREKIGEFPARISVRRYLNKFTEAGN